MNGPAGILFRGPGFSVLAIGLMVVSGCSGGPDDFRVDGYPEYTHTLPDDNESANDADLTAASAGTFDIDLPTAMRLVRTNSLVVALTREKVAEADAKLDQASLLLLPDLRVGASYHHHDGPLQETNGNILDVKRTSGYAGLGSGAVGAGDVARPGLGLEVDLADAIYEPLAAHRRRSAARAGNEATTHHQVLEVVLVYYELLRAKMDLAIAEETRQNTDDLATLTANFAKAGEGLEADSERAAVSLLIQKGKHEVAAERMNVQSSKLVELLNLNGSVSLQPTDKAVVPMQMVPDGGDLQPLIRAAWIARPEMEEAEAWTQYADARVEQARNSPWIPKLSAGASLGGFAGSGGTALDDDDDRLDASIAIYWELGQLGFGNMARTRERKSQLRQRQNEHQQVQNRIASEVAQAHAQVESGSRQIDLAAQAVERALRSYGLSRARIHENKGLPVEVLQAIGSLATARKLYVDSVIDQNQAQFRLWSALGQPDPDAPSEEPR